MKGFSELVRTLKPLRYLVLATVVILLLGLLSSCSNTSGGGKAVSKTDEVVAKVNGEPIYMRQLVDELLSRYGKPTLEDLIIKKIIEQEAAKEGIQVTEDEIKKAISRLEKQVGGKESLNLRLQGSNISRKALEEEVRYQILLKKLILKREVDPSDLKIYYETELKPNGPFAEVSIIVVTDKRLADSIVKQAKSGTPFEKLARQYSMAATSNLGGTPPNGYVGIIGKKQVESGALLKSFIPPQLSKPIFSAKPGQIVGPIEIKARNGEKLYYIIKVDKIMNDFDSMKDIVEDMVANAKAQQFLMKLRRKANIERLWSPDNGDLTDSSPNASANPNK